MRQDPVASQPRQEGSGGGAAPQGGGAAPPPYGPQIIAALLFCWAVLGAPTGKRLKPVMADLVPRLRRFGEPARAQPHRAGVAAQGLHPDPDLGQWDDAVPGFVEIDLVGHEGGRAMGEHPHTLTVTDIAAGCTENRSVPNKARKWVVAALEEIADIMAFPLLGIDNDNDNDNDNESINHHLLSWSEQRTITFTRSRPGNSNDGAHVEQKSGAVGRTVVGYHRYDTAAELLLLNRSGSCSR